MCGHDHTKQYIHVIIIKNYILLFVVQVEINIYVTNLQKYDAINVFSTNLGHINKTIKNTYDFFDDK